MKEQKANQDEVNLFVGNGDKVVKRECIGNVALNLESGFI